MTSWTEEKEPAERQTSIDLGSIGSKSSLCDCAGIKVRRKMLSGKDSTVHVFDKTKSKLSPTTCGLCRLVVQCFEKSREAFISLDVLHLIERRSEHNHEKTVTMFRLHDLELLPLAEDAYMFNQPPARYARLIDSQYTNRDAIKGWLRACDEGHTQCQQSALDLFGSHNEKIPARLVNVHTMCVEHGPFENPRYFALSYVWGDIPRKDLDQWSAQEMMQPGFLNVDIHSKLHKTVIDAIQLTRELGAEYIWIDCLCIDQTDYSKKAREIRNMNNIYMRAAMTIIALDSDHAEEGLPGVSPYTPPRSAPVIEIDGIRLLSTTSITSFRRRTVQSQSLEESSEEVVVPHPHNLFETVRNLERFNFEQTNKLEQIEVCAPFAWHQRAWTMQETLFSRRKLFLTAQQAYFSCATTAKAEYQMDDPRNDQSFWSQGPGFNQYNLQAISEQADKLYLRKTVMTTKSTPSEIEKIQQAVEDAKPLWKAWTHLIELYSARHVTMPEDRYHAFRGIEAELYQVFKLKSIEGLPLDILPLSLFWYHESSEHAPITQSIKRIEQYPSWSWIGWNGPVHFYYPWHEHMSLFVRDVTIVGETASVDLHYSKTLGANKPGSALNSGKFYESGTQRRLRMSPEQQLQTLTNLTFDDDPQSSQYRGSGGLKLYFQAPTINIANRYINSEQKHIKKIHSVNNRQTGFILPSQSSTVLDDDQVGITCVLVGISNRELSWTYRNGYRSSDKTLSAFKTRKRLKYCFNTIVALPLPIYLGVHFLSRKGTTVKTICVIAIVVIPLLIAIIASLVDLVLEQVAYHLGFNKVANFIWVEEAGEGIYERRGMGEMAFRQFQKFKPKMMPIKLR